MHIPFSLMVAASAWGFIISEYFGEADAVSGFCVDLS